MPKDLFLFFLLLLSLISLGDKEASKELIDRISIPLIANDWNENKNMDDIFAGYFEHKQKENTSVLYIISS